MHFYPRPNFRIELTDHAKESLRERVRCSRNKFQKLAEKAWASSDFADPREIPNKRFYEKEKFVGKLIKHKRLLGQLWVFEYRHSENKAILVTVYPPVPKPPKKIRYLSSPAKKKPDLTDAEQYDTF